MLWCVRLMWCARMLLELVGIRIPAVGEELNVAEMVDQGFTSLPAAGDILENYFFSSSAHIL